MPKGLVGYKKHLPYLDVKGMETQARTILASQNQDFDTEYKIYNNKEMMYISHILRILAPGFEKFSKYLDDSQTGGGHRIKALCLIVPTPDKPEMVNVYTGLTFAEPMNYTRDLRFVSRVYKTHLLDSFAKAREEASQNEKAWRAWETIKRVATRAKRCETMTVAAALTRYTDAKTGGLKDDQIRDIAGAFVDSRKPVHISIAETPADFMDMYSHGPASCMTENGNRAWSFMMKHGNHPASFYSYFPHTRGAYIKKGAKIAARCMLYEYKDDKQYGRIYASNGSDRSALETNLMEQGYRAITNTSWRCKDFTAPVQFSIPGIPHGDNKGFFVMPMPYLDNLHGRMRYVFDEATQVFNVTYMPPDAPDFGSFSSNIDVNGTRGYIEARIVAQATCTHCGLKNTYDNMFHHTAKDAVYCSEGCMSAQNVCSAMRSDSTRVVVDIDDNVIEDATRATVYYTNLEAAKALRAMPIMTDPYVPEEDTDALTRYQQYTVAFNGGIYGLPEAHMIRNREGNNNFNTSRTELPVVVRNMGRIRNSMTINIQKVRSLQMEMEGYNVEIDGEVINCDTLPPEPAPVKVVMPRRTGKSVLYSGTALYQDTSVFSGEELEF